MLLIRPAARASFGSLDHAQAERLGRAALGHLELTTTRELIRLGSDISPRVSGLREEIVFVGARNASEATHIFAPEGVLPGHVEQLAKDLTGLPTGTDPGAAAAISGFYGAHLHPFIDGNGRWARALAAYVGGKLGSPAAGVISAVYLTYFKDELVRNIWPSARSGGLSSYLRLGAVFENAMRESLRDSEAIGAVERLLSTFSKYAPTRRASVKFLIRYFSGNKSALTTVKQEFGLSSRREEGLVQEVATIFHELDSTQSGAEALDWLTNDAIRHITQVKGKVLGEIR